MLAMTGAGGKLGTAVVKAILELSAPTSLRLGSRNRAALAEFETAGIQTLHADFDQPDSLAHLFDGADAVLIISGDAPNELRIKQHRAAFESARRAGVGRIVYTSFANAVATSKFLVAQSHVESEAILKTLGTPYTVLRNGLYAENIMIEAARATGELVQPNSEGKAAYITYADLARATAGALLGDGHENKTYTLTGPEALNHFDIADRLTAAWDRSIRVRNVTPEAYREALSKRGLPDFVIDLLLSLHDAIGAGEYERITKDASDLAGRDIEQASAFLARA